MKKNNAVCLICGEEKALHNFSKHRNEQLSSNVGFCKDCVRDSVDPEDKDSVIDMLRLLNIPFLNDVWENAIQKEKESPFSKYLQMIATKRKYKTFSDGESIQVGTPDDEFQITREMIARWGSGKSKDDYFSMETKYETLANIKEPQTAFEKELYVQNVKLSKTLDKALESGDSKTIPQLSKAYKEDLKKLGLDIGSSNTDESSSIGTRIQVWENTKPIPSLSSEFDDVDNIKGYVNKYFVVPMKRVFGRATQEEVDALYD